jgi:hypothetical protein
MFEANYEKVEGIKDKLTVDNYSFLKLSAFARWWNLEITRRGSMHSDITYKTAAILKDAWKSYIHRLNKETTMLDITDDQEALQMKHRVACDEGMELVAVTVPRAHRASAVPVQRNASTTGDTYGNNNDDDDLFISVDDDNDESPAEREPSNSAAFPFVTPRFISDSGSDGLHYHASIQEGVVLREPDGKRMKIQKRAHRCCRCGRGWRLQEWAQYHQADNTIVLNQSITPQHELCTVPEVLIAAQFPCLVGRMLGNPSVCISRV